MIWVAVDWGVEGLRSAELGGGQFGGGALVESAEGGAVRRQGHLAAPAVFGEVLAERLGVGFTRHKLSFLCGLWAHGVSLDGLLT
jgi:hypothetical protein